MEPVTGVPSVLFSNYDLFRKFMSFRGQKILPPILQSEKAVNQTSSARPTHSDTPHSPVGIVPRRAPPTTSLSAPTHNQSEVTLVNVKRISKGKEKTTQCKKSKANAQSRERKKLRKDKEKDHGKKPQSETRASAQILDHPNNKKRLRDDEGKKGQKQANTTTKFKASSTVKPIGKRSKLNLDQNKQRDDKADVGPVPSSSIRNPPSLIPTGQSGDDSLLRAGNPEIRKTIRKRSSKLSKKHEEIAIQQVIVNASRKGAIHAASVRRQPNSTSRPSNTLNIERIQPRNQSLSWPQNEVLRRQEVIECCSNNAGNAGESRSLRHTRNRSVNLSQEDVIDCDEVVSPAQCSIINVTADASRSRSRSRSRNQMETGKHKAGMKQNQNASMRQELRASLNVNNGGSQRGRVLEVCDGLIGSKHNHNRNSDRYLEVKSPLKQNSSETPSRKTPEAEPDSKHDIGGLGSAKKKTEKQKVRRRTGTQSNSKRKVQTTLNLSGSRMDNIIVIEGSPQKSPKSQKQASQKRAPVQRRSGAKRGSSSAKMEVVDLCSD